MKQQAMEEIVEMLKEFALQKPDTLLMAIAQCTAILAMNGSTQEQLSWFDQQTNGIINDYIGTSIPDVHIEKDGRIH
ncbi:MAG: hypothetical protein ABS948_07755 [Solibacillus sp.]